MLLRTALAATLLLTAVACGQKGPLYLPDSGGEVVTRPGQAGSTQSPQTTPPPPQNPAERRASPDEEDKAAPPR